MFSHVRELSFQNHKGFLGCGIALLPLAGLFVASAIMVASRIERIGPLTVDEEMRGNMLLALGYLVMGLMMLLFGSFYIIGSGKVAITLSDISIQWSGLRGRIVRTVLYVDIENVVDDVDGEIVVVLKNPLPYKFFDGRHIPIDNLFFCRRGRKEIF